MTLLIEVSKYVLILARPRSGHALDGVDRVLADRGHLGWHLKNEK